MGWHATPAKNAIAARAASSMGRPRRPGEPRTGKCCAASEVCFEPIAEVLILCCARSQREKCGMSEKRQTAAQRKIRPFVQVATWIRSRIYGPQDADEAATTARALVVEAAWRSEYRDSEDKRVCLTIGTSQSTDRRIKSPRQYANSISDSIQLLERSAVAMTNLSNFIPLVRKRPVHTLNLVRTDRD